MLSTLKDNRSLTFYQPTASQLYSPLTTAHTGGLTAGAIANTAMSVQIYTGNVRQAFFNLKSSVIQRGMGYVNSNRASRGGYMAENFVAESYNLDAVIKGEAPSAVVPESNGAASPDIVYGDNQQASLKFYVDAKASANKQTNPAYGDQVRIVPADQLDGAKARMDELIQSDIAKDRGDALQIHQKVKGLLDDRIRGDNGVESIPLTKKQDLELADGITLKDGVATVNEGKIDNSLNEIGVTKKVRTAIRNNEMHGLGLAAAIGAGVGFTLGFAAALAQSGTDPDSIRMALGSSVKSGAESGLLSTVGYGLGRTLGQTATAAVTGFLTNLGVEVTENVARMCSMGVVGTLTISVFSVYQFAKLKIQGADTREALIQVGKQAAFSLSLLAASITVQGLIGGAAGIIVSAGIGFCIVSYSLVSTAYQRQFAEELQIYMIEKCKPIFLDNSCFSGSPHVPDGYRLAENGEDPDAYINEEGSIIYT